MGSMFCWLTRHVDLANMAQELFLSCGLLEGLREPQVQSMGLFPFFLSGFEVWAPGFYVVYTRYMGMPRACDAAVFRWR